MIEVIEKVEVVIGSNDVNHIGNKLMEVRSIGLTNEDKMRTLKYEIIKKINEITQEAFEKGREYERKRLLSTKDELE